jgi:hypothetical protein
MEPLIEEKKKLRAEELRIGNILNARFHHNTAPNGGGFFWRPVVVGTINEDSITTKFGERIELEEKLLQYLPLTEDWLLRMGFVKYKSQWSLSVGGELSIYFDNGNIILWQVHESCYSMDRVFRSKRHNHPKPSLEVTSVHQLQNLYYALTSQELTIKE